MNQSAAKYIVN